MRNIIFICLLFCSKLIAQAKNDIHSFWFNYEINQQTNKDLQPALRTIKMYPSFSAGIQYRMLISKKLNFYGTSCLVYRRQNYQSEFYFTPNVFMNRTDLDFGKWVDFKVNKNLNTLNFGLGGIYKIPRQKFDFWMSGLANVHYLMYNTSEGTRGSTISMSYMGSDYSGVMSKGSYYFGESILFSGCLRLGIGLRKQTEHPIEIGIGYTYGGRLGVIEYTAYNYLGTITGNIKDNERIESVDLTFGVKF
jgi:hypothetical protein